MSLSKYKYIIQYNQNYLLDYRLVLYSYIKRILKTYIPKSNDFVCLNNSGNFNLMTIMNKKQLMTDENKYSDVYKLSLKPLRKFNVTPHISIKVIPLSHEERTKMYNTDLPIWKELQILLLMTKLTKQRKIPNFPIIYNYYICNNCVYKNPNLKDNKEKICLLILNEYNKYDLKSWLVELSKEAKSDSELIDIWYNCLFQIYASLYFLYNKFSIIQNDLHWGNILITIHDKKGYWTYTINGLKYYIPNLGFTVKLWDFGKSQQKTEIDNNNKMSASFVSDISRFSNIYVWINHTNEIKNKNVIPRNIIELLENLKQNKSTDFIYKIMSRYLHNKIGEKIPSYILKETADVQYIDNFVVGELVCYNNKYAIIQEFFKFKIYLITEQSEHIYLKSVHFSKVKKIITNISQNKTKYFNQENLGNYVL